MKRSKSSAVFKRPSEAVLRKSFQSKRASNFQSGTRRRVTKSSSNADDHYDNSENALGKSAVRYQPQPADGQLSNLSPEEDWRLWWKAPLPMRHHTWETDAEKERKHELIQQVINGFPHVPHQLDTARLKAVISELNVGFRVASLLPTLLFTDDPAKLDVLGDDVNRTLQLFRLQLELATNAIMPPEIVQFSEEELGSEGLGRESFDASESDLEVHASESLTEDDQVAEGSDIRIATDFDGALFSFKETFHTLCLAFRDSCNYDLLAKAERVFGHTTKELPTWPVVSELRDLTHIIMELLLNGLQSTPFDTRELQKVSDQMTEATKTAEGNKRLVRHEYEGIMHKYRKEQQLLAGSIRQGERQVEARLRELQEARATAQTKIRRQVGDDSKPHEAKLARMEKDVEETVSFISSQNKERYLLETAHMSQLRDHGALMAADEKNILENCVQLKAEIIALLERKEMLETILAKMKEEEQSAEKEMLELVKDRQERDEGRRRAEAEALRRHKAAIVIQKWWRGYKVRKMLKKGKKKGKGKGKGKKGKGKSKSKTPTTPAKAKGKSKK
ncbi:dynein regulatory complex protein 10-like [Paramacrobiotus metropolitanus]|uniref:dynein regulatory complex protein 10-like n=1 Tax=Paramacrobiotus metropolitanus TaxID=2943436 RepID=UPI002445FC0F|nr:dynein regulatory complex protein 10-like [Paramacrobiotus metropolitanus]XP_055342869.1 dynein regulatory complex protein 10-like [Paramacrobiotus metropolitanus]